jgi:hypothetical protein
MRRRPRGLHRARVHHDLRRGQDHDPDRGRIRMAGHPARYPAHHPRHPHVRDAGPARRDHRGLGRARADGRRAPGAPGVRQTRARRAAPDAPCCWRAGSPGDRRHGRSDRRCPDADAPPPDRRRRVRRTARHEALVGTPAGARLESPRASRRVLRPAARPEVQAGPPERRSRGRRWGRRPLDDVGADHGADGAPRRARQPSAAAGRHPSARAPMVHRDTDCRPHRNRGTARHWCGCGEWGVCVRSFENCEWYGGLRSDLEGSATPQQA